MDRDGEPAVEGGQLVSLPIGTHTLEWMAATQMNMMTDVFVPAELLSFGVLTEIKNVSVGLDAAKKVKQAGKMQLNGKDYVIEDGDICHFLFNV
ncbi:MAG: DUF933 domain-containing protein [Deinococcales bacterium]